MISDPTPPGGKASLDDIITLLATTAGPAFMGALILSLDQQVSRVRKTNRKTNHVDYSLHITKENEEVKRPGKKTVYKQTFLYKKIPIVMVEFSNNWTIHKLKLPKSE